MHFKSTLRNPSDRTINRLIVGAIAFLVVGTLVVGAIYLSDRWVDRGPTMVERRIQDLEAAVKANPNVISTRLQLVGAYVAAGRDPDALTQLNEVVKVQPDSKTALLARGDLYHRAASLDAAAKDYQTIVDIMQGAEFAPEDTELESAFYGLGQIALERKKPADAIGPLTSALKIDGANADTLNLLGSAYLATGVADKAVTVLRQAIAFVPTDWCDPYQTIGQAYTKLGNSAEAAWAAAMAQFCGKQPDVAKQQLQALVNGPAATDAYLGLGMIAEAASDQAGAADAYGKVLARDPSNFNAQTGLSRVTGPGPATSAHPSPPVPSPAAGGTS